MDYIKKIHFFEILNYFNLTPFFEGEKFHEYQRNKISLYLLFYDSKENEYRCYSIIEQRLISKIDLIFELSSVFPSTEQLERTINEISLIVPLKKELIPQNISSIINLSAGVKKLNKEKKTFVENSFLKSFFFSNRNEEYILILTNTLGEKQYDFINFSKEGSTQRYNLIDARFVYKDSNEDEEAAYLFFCPWTLLLYSIHETKRGAVFLFPNPSEQYIQITESIKIYESTVLCYNAFDSNSIKLLLEYIFSYLSYIQGDAYNIYEFPKYYDIRINFGQTTDNIKRVKFLSRILMLDYKKNGVDVDNFEETKSFDEYKYNQQNFDHPNQRNVSIRLKKNSFIMNDFLNKIILEYNLNEIFDFKIIRTEEVKPDEGKNKDSLIEF